MESFPLVLTNASCLNGVDIERIFEIFKNDFMDNRVILTVEEIAYEITVKENVTCSCPFTGDSKPERFWHIITKKEFDAKKQNNPCSKDKEKKRVYCSFRARRVHWIKEIIDGFGKEEHIKYFCEDNGAKTHFLWDTKRFYIVLIKHLGRSNNLLVTAYSVHKNKYRDYQKRLKKYEKSL
jgi:hypothetical protein